jgi:hypothetical protein
MQGNFDQIEEMIKFAMSLIHSKINHWCGKFPLDEDQCRNVIRAGFQAGVLGRSSQFYAAQWMFQCYSLKPDPALMRILKALDAVCDAYVSMGKVTLPKGVAQEPCEDRP